MREENLDYQHAEGIVDVSVIVPSCFENPLKVDSVDFVKQVLSQEKTAIVPVSAIIGAYHIATRYLRVSRVLAKTVFAELLRTHSDAFYPEITVDLASVALDYAATCNVESWDGYLLALARKVDAKLIFSMDQELRNNIPKEEHLTVQNPFATEKVRAYHRFLEARKFV